MPFEQLVEHWDAALEAYGTPPNFSDGTYVDLIFNHESPNDIPMRLVTAPGYGRRKQHMEKLREISVGLLDLPPRWPKDRSECFLCDNVGQAMAIGNNLLLQDDSYENHILLPNRFPFVKGHCLLISKDHDTDDKKVGNVLTQEYLEVTRDVCDRYGLTGARNHALAGMSVPSHEHLHVYPLRLETRNGGVTSLCALDELPTYHNGDDGMEFVDKSHFDTRIFSRDAISDLVNVMDKLENGGLIFTLLYGGGKFYLTPHINRHPDTTIISASSPKYMCVKSEEEGFSYLDNIGLIKQHLPLRGTFPWKDYN